MGWVKIQRKSRVKFRRNSTLHELYNGEAIEDVSVAKNAIYGNLIHDTFKEMHDIFEQVEIDVANIRNHISNFR